MRRLATNSYTSLVGVVLALASCAAAIGAPSQLIRNLRAGQSQTVVTYGTSLTRPAEWPEQLAAWFEAEFPGQAQVINRGIASMSSPEALARLDTLVLSQNPDTVFLEFAVNDALADRNISLQQSRDNLNTMIDRILADGPAREIILMTMNPAWDSPLGSHATFRPNLAQYYQGYRDVAADRGLLLIDHYPNWVNLRDANLSLFEQFIPDGVHPTAEALRQVVTPEITRAMTIPEPATFVLAGSAAAAFAIRYVRRVFRSAGGR
jgi:acyl-CoA thioesterase-1